VLSVDTVYKSWADATEISTDSELTTDEPSTTQPIDERPYFHLNITFNEMVGSNGEDAFDTHFDAIIEVLSNYLDCDKEAIDTTPLSYAGLSVKARFAISGKSEEEVAHVIDDIWHPIKLPLKFVLNGVPVLSVDTVYKSWADAAETSTDSELTTAEPSTTEPMDDQRAAICEEEPTNGWIWDGVTQDIGSNCESLPSSSHGCDRPWTQANCAYTCGSCFGTDPNTTDNWCDDDIPENYLGSGNAERRTCPNSGTCTIDDITFECVGSEWILVEKIPYFHLNITFSEGFNGAEAYESHRDAIQTVMSNYLECDKTAINATFITHMDMSAEVKFVITGMSERQVARIIDDSWHFLKLPLKFILNGVPVIGVDTVHTSWERNIYDSSSALLTVFMASFLLLCIFF